MKKRVLRRVLFFSIFVILTLIIGMGCVSAATITVTSPNGCEIWRPGNTYTITWTSTGISSNDNVSISITFSGVINAKTRNDGSYSWTVPSGTPDNNHNLAAINKYGDNSIIDYSDRYFKIGPNTISCTDSDYGQTTNIRGNVSGQDGGVSYFNQDQCTNPTRLQEFYCCGNMPLQIELNPPSGQTCENGVICTKKTCAGDYPGKCAYGLSDGCADGILDCRNNCLSGQVCNSGTCCTPYTCAANYPGFCGSYSNGCDGTLNCAGNCAAGQVCNSGTCCNPYTCAANYPGLCGSKSNNCGGTLNCNCPSGQVCNSGTCCNPYTCAANYPGFCGSYSNGCDGTLNCAGNCAAGQVCNSGTCCTPSTCASLGKNCSSWSNGCGGTLSCGSCTSPATCNATGQCVTPTSPSGGDITNCMTINSPGTYILQNNINVVSEGACIYINSSNVIVDGNGKKISHSNSTFGEIGVFGKNLNITIKNLTLENFNGTFASGISAGFFNNLTISNNKINNNFWGISVGSGASNYLISGNEGLSNEYGLFIQTTQDNGARTNISNNKFCNNQVKDAVIVNLTASGCLNLKGTGNQMNIVDTRCAGIWPVLGTHYAACVGACGDTSCNGGETCSSCPADCGSCGGGYDITNCMIINSPGHYILQNNINVASGDVCIYINSSNVVVDGNGKKISNLGTVDYEVTYGILADNLTNIVIKNLTLDNFYSQNIRLRYINNITVSDNELTNSLWGISGLNVSNSIFSNNNLNDNSYGMYFAGGNNSVISNNSLNNNTNSLALVVVTHFVILKNIVRDQREGGIFIYNSYDYSIRENEVSSTYPGSFGFILWAEQNNGAKTNISDNKFCNNQKNDTFIQNTSSAGCLNLKGTGNQIGSKIYSGCAWPVLGVDYTACGGSAVCGNGIIEGSEECDDGNIYNGVCTISKAAGCNSDDDCTGGADICKFDGCSSDCQIEEVDITNCMTINSPGTYILQNNINVVSGDVCILINSSNVIVNGNGKKISNLGTVDYGILADNLTNITIKNLTLNNFSIQGIRLYYINNVTVSDNDLTNSPWGISCKNVSNSTFSGNNLDDKNFNMYFIGGNNLVISNNNLNNSTNSLVFVGTSNFIILKNIVSQRGGGIELFDSYDYSIRENEVSSTSPGTFGLIVWPKQDNGIKTDISNNKICNNQKNSIIYTQIHNTTSAGCLNLKGTGNQMDKVFSDCAWPVLGTHYSDCDSSAPSCGNGIIDAGETCDGTNLGGKICSNFDSYTGGTLVCGGDCHFRTSGCTPNNPGPCGNGIINDDEECDGLNLDGKSCADYDSFTAGTLTCTSCKANTSLCTTGPRLSGSCSNLSVSDCTNPSKWSDDILQDIESNYPDASVPGGFCTGEPYSENIPGYSDCRLTLKCSCVWDGSNDNCIGNVENALINLTADGCDGIITGNCTQSAPDVKGDCTTNDLQTIITTSSWFGTPLPTKSDYIYTSYIGCITDSNVTREIPCPPKSEENLPFFGIFNLIIAGIMIAIGYFMINARRRK